MSRSTHIHQGGAGERRPDGHDPDTLSESSWAVHGGNRGDTGTGAIRTPIVMANSYRLPNDPTTLDECDHDTRVYTRESGANQLGLQVKLAAAEHGEAAVVFATGMAALHGCFFTLLNPGDHVSFAIAGDHEDCVRFVNDLRVIASAVSLGHDETLIAYERYPEERAAAFAPVYQQHGLIRLAVGLESEDDLIADLDAALTTTYGPAR